MPKLKKDLQEGDSLEILILNMFIGVLVAGFAVVSGRFIVGLCYFTATVIILAAYGITWFGISIMMEGDE